MPFDYAWQKFFGATHGMATSDAPPRERLRDAFIYNLLHLQERDFPPELWETYKPILQRVTREEPIGDKGSVETTIERVSDTEVHDTPSQIVSLQNEVTAIARDW